MSSPVLAVEVVVPGLSAQQVGAGTAGEEVDSRPAEELVGAGAAFESVGPVRAADAIVARSAREAVVARTADDGRRQAVGHADGVVAVAGLHLDRRDVQSAAGDHADRSQTAARSAGRALTPERATVGGCDYRPRPEL